MVDNQTTDPRGSENSKQDKYQKKGGKKTLQVGISFSEHRKLKVKEKSWKKPGRFICIGAKMRITTDLSSETMQTKRQ